MHEVAGDLFWALPKFFKTLLVILKQPPKVEKNILIS